ncbi:AraC family transcriptional regulator [Mesorhizobium sp. BAC0120]|uniref:AraC family transcriptional regulator n=1 Tax=Mesorhizobium sp. BAC0120 TaxID=3090670 RepID=UPI00298BEF47|nr:AraC family transcriptional regulator [Mesorhizobium sp. BAC0120]MDW6020816.1 AraC family transcriptional regulator [Mesorhizobium sp. BAC0120]
MLDHSSKLPSPSAGDPLTEMMRGLRLDGVEYGRCVMAEPWGIHFPQQSAARFHFIGLGNCYMLTPSKEWIELRPGDAVLVPRGAEHVLSSAPGVPTGPLERYEVKPVCGNIFDVSCFGEGPKSLLFCGSMRFNLDSLHPLLALMPDMMRAHDLAKSEPTVPHLLEAMVREVMAERVGSSGMLARLADVLAATIVRAWVEGGCGDATGWIAAVRNPQIGRVLAAIHLDPSREWTVPALARIMGASRSGFAQRFAEIVGETPARYVARVRMHQARQWLTRDGLRISVVARQLGYDSEASFSRAFKRVLGHAPSHFRAKPEGEPGFGERLLAHAADAN